MQTAILKITLLTLLLMAGNATSQAQENPALDKFLKIAPDAQVYQGVFCEAAHGHIFHANILKKRVIDESNLRIIYEAAVVCDTAKGTRCKDRMICQIGDGWYKSYGESLWKSNMRAYPPKGENGKEDYKQDSGYDDTLAEVTYRDIKGLSVTTKGQMPQMLDKVFSYVEPLQPIGWTLEDETKEVLGYLCQKAEASFRGRHWTVWFTTEIPVDCGLWKFSGLPGLILEAADDRGDYEFSASKVEQVEEPIYEELPNEKRMTRDKYRKLEKSIYDDPLAYDTLSGGILITAVKDPSLTGDEVFTPGHYRIIYNPMELE